MKQVQSGGWAEMEEWMGPVMKLEEVSSGQGKDREEGGHQHVRDALEETAACRTPYACVSVCTCVHVCVCTCEFMRGQFWGQGRHPWPPARNHAHRCPAGIPTNADTPALECQKPARAGAAASKSRPKAAEGPG